VNAAVEPVQPAAPISQISFVLHGVAAAPGIAIARAQLVSHATLEVAHYDVAPEQIEAELARFDTALAAVRADFEALHERMKGEDAPAEFGAFLDVHWMILTDTQLSKDPKLLIEEQRCNAEWAVTQKMNWWSNSVSSTISTCASVPMTWCRWWSASSRR